MASPVKLKRQPPGKSRAAEKDFSQKKITPEKWKA
jgi:hypothetical protein